MATVLIVDDDRDAREMLRTALRLDGHAVAEAAGALEGVQLARLLQPDVVVTDQRMGRDGDGILLIRALREAGEACAIVMWTGADDVREMAEAAGATQVLSKGRDSLATLRAAVRDGLLVAPRLRVVADA